MQASSGASSVCKIICSIIADHLLHCGSCLACADAKDLLDDLPADPLFDLVPTSPPYNLGKVYEKRRPLDDYFSWQREIIEKVAGTSIDVSAFLYALTTMEGKRNVNSTTTTT